MRYGAMLAAALGTGCVGAEFVTGTNFSAGTYRAAIFLVRPSGQDLINVLEAGGSLSITVAADGTTSGSLEIPASVPGGPLTASMAGTATITGLTVRFQQNADSFVRDLTWLRVEGTLQVAEEAAGDALFTITLER